MDKNKFWKWLLLAFLVLWSITLVVPNGFKLGLDLRGGSSFVVEVDKQDLKEKMVENNEVSSIDKISPKTLNDKIKETQELAIEVIRNRIDQSGTAEAEIYPEGNNRVVVRIPGADEQTRKETRKQIERVAVLSFKLVHKRSFEWVEELRSKHKAPYGYKGVHWDGKQRFYYVRDKTVPKEKIDPVKMKRFGSKPADFMLEEERLKNGAIIYYPYYIEHRNQLTGNMLRSANVSSDPNTGALAISITFNDEGTKKFAEVTKRYAKDEAKGKPGRLLGIILDNKLYSAPHLITPIYSGNAQITGSFTLKEARRLVNVLRAGALPGKVNIIEERTVAPTLGEDSISSGINAILLGGLAVLIFMGVYYLIPGLLANLSLFFMLILLPVGMVVSAGFLGASSGSLEGGAISLPTLTLYGIAGIVLTVGMAVDANVLTFERMREEWKVGKSVSGAINAGYDKAFSTILDANVTTLLTAIILFWQGSGPIRGFAVTLSAGILVSMFVVLVITRLFFTSLADAKILKSLKMNAIPKLANASFDFIGKRKIAISLSLLLIVGTWIGVFIRGDDNLGVDFKGGTVMTFKFDNKVPAESIRNKLKQAGFPSAKVNYQSELTGNQEILEIKVGVSNDAAKPALSAILSLDGKYKLLKNDSVGSQIGKELRNKGIKAIIWALIGIIIYVSLRFEFSFAVGAIVALIHDVLITIGIYSVLGHELSMPIIAALLTIVGYSVNDTIVVFDRIREDLKFEKGKTYAEIANLSVNQTLSRTLITSFTTLLTVIMLLLFGGGAVFDFALALFIGIVVGTYSSIFIATPIVLFWHRDEKVKN